MRGPSGAAPPAYPVQDPFAIPAPVPATGNPFAAPAMNPLAYGELLVASTLMRLWAVFGS